MDFIKTLAQLADAYHQYAAAPLGEQIALGLVVIEARAKAIAAGATHEHLATAYQVGLKGVYVDPFPGESANKRVPSPKTGRMILISSVRSMARRAAKLYAAAI